MQELQVSLPAGKAFETRIATGRSITDHADHLVFNSLSLQ
jgi:hypothetical protein